MPAAGAFQTPSQGYMVQPQPMGMYPGPPLQQQQPAMAPGGPQPPVAMPPGANSLRPVPDQNITMMQPGGVPIQQVNYEQPQRGSFINWLKRQTGRNPALSEKNTTAPSLQNGNDGRLGRGGTFRPQQAPQRYRQPVNPYQP